jgi:predicted dehydrogenase
MIDQAIQLFGKPESVYARIETHRPNNRVDDLFRLHLRFGSGVQAVLMTDLMAPITGPRFQVRGLCGTFEKFGLDPQEAALRAGEFPRGDNWGVEDPTNWGRLIDGHIATVPGDYRSFYRAVHKALQKGESPFQLEDIVIQLQVIEAALRSAQTNTVQTIE